MDILGIIFGGIIAWLMGPIVGSTMQSAAAIQAARAQAQAAKLEAERNKKGAKP